MILASAINIINTMMKLFQKKNCVRHCVKVGPVLCNIRPYTTRSNRWNGEIHQNLSLVLIQQEQLWLKQISIKCGTNETESRKKLTDAHGIHLSPVLCWASGVKDCRPWCCSPEFELLFHSKQRWIIFLWTGNNIDLHLGEDFVRVLPTMRWMWFHQLLLFFLEQAKLWITADKQFILEDL